MVKQHTKRSTYCKWQAEQWGTCGCYLNLCDYDIITHTYAHRSACTRRSTHICSQAHMHRLPVWSLADSYSDPTLMQPCRGLSSMPGLPRAQTDARCTPPYQQSCCQTTQGDSKWEQRVVFSFLTHTYVRTHTMWFILSDSYPHTHTEHNAGRQAAIRGLFIGELQYTSSINLQASVFKVYKALRR